MTDQKPTDWFFREGGVVTQTARDVADPTRFHLENGLARQICGVPLSDLERDAVEAFTTAGGPLSLSAFNSADARIAAIAAARRDVLETLDRFAAELAGDLGGLGELLAWDVLGDYCDRARGVTASELGLEADEPPEAVSVPGGDPEGWSQIPPRADR